MRGSSAGSGARLPRGRACLRCGSGRQRGRVARLRGGLEQRLGFVEQPALAGVRLARATKQALAGQAELLVEFEDAGLEGLLLLGALRFEGFLLLGPLPCKLPSQFSHKGDLLGLEQGLQGGRIVRQNRREHAPDRVGGRVQTRL